MLPEEKTSIWSGRAWLSPSRFLSQKQQKSHNEGQDNKLAMVIASTYTDHIGEKTL